VAESPLVLTLLRASDAIRPKDAAKADALGVAAGRLDAAIAGGDAKAILGAWARGRRLLCEVTGEPLVPPAVSETGARLLQVLNALRPKP
jgi:hypothetical protein